MPVVYLVDENAYSGLAKTADRFDESLMNGRISLAEEIREKLIDSLEAGSAVRINFPESLLDELTVAAKASGDPDIEKLSGCTHLDVEQARRYSEWMQSLSIQGTARIAKMVLELGAAIFLVP